MADLANRLNITAVSLSQSLAGNPTYSRLRTIADVLNVDITELFTSKQGKQPLIDGFIEINGNTHRILSIYDIEKALAQARLLSVEDDYDNYRNND